MEILRKPILVVLFYFLMRLTSKKCNKVLVKIRASF